MRLPPYAKDWLSMLDRNPILKTEIEIYVGKKSLSVAAHELSRFKPVMALPHDMHYLEYTWPVKGNRIIVINTGGFGVDNLYQFAAALTILKASFITLSSEEDDHFIQFISNKIYE